MSVVEANGEMEHSFLVGGALWTLEVAMPLGEVSGERSCRNILQRTAWEREEEKNNYLA